MKVYEILFYIEVPAGTTPAEVVERLNKNNIKASLLYVAEGIVFILVTIQAEAYTIDQEFPKVTMFFYLAYDFLINNKHWMVLNYYEYEPVTNTNMFLVTAETVVDPASYKYYDNIINLDDTAGSLIKRELYLNFDYLCIGNIDCNIILSNANYTIVLCSYSENHLTTKAIENSIDWITSAIINIDAVVTGLNIIYL